MKRNVHKNTGATEPPASGTSPGTTPDTDIERYETMPLDEINKQLREAGIDPRATLKAVRELVQKRLRQRKR